MDLSTAGTYTGPYTITTNATYGPGSETTILNGDLYVDSDATLQNLEVNGTIYIDPGTSGTVILNNVTATDIEILSGGTESIHLNDVTVTNLLTINATNNQVHVVIGNVTNITNTLVQSDANIKVESDAKIGKITVDATGAGAQINNEGTITDLEANGDVEISGTDPENVTSGENVDVSTKVSTKVELEEALLNGKIKTITIKENIGTENDYTVYYVDRTVTIQGMDENSKVFGTFMIKANDVTIQDLAIQNEGDLGGNQTNGPEPRANIVVFAKNVTIKNNTLTHGLGGEDGLANAIQIFSTVADNQLSNYIIEKNVIEGFNNEARGSSSAAILIAQGYESTIIGKEFAEIIKATPTDYEELLTNNTLTNNAINLTHQDWEGGLEVLYPVDPDVEELE